MPKYGLPPAELEMTGRCGHMYIYIYILCEDQRNVCMCVCVSSFAEQEGELTVLLLRSMARCFGHFQYVIIQCSVDPGGSSLLFPGLVAAPNCGGGGALTRDNRPRGVFRRRNEVAGNERKRESGVEEDSLVAGHHLDRALKGVHFTRGAVKCVCVGLMLVSEGQQLLWVFLANQPKPTTRNSEHCRQILCRNEEILIYFLSVTISNTTTLIGRTALCAALVRRFVRVQSLLARRARGEGETKRRRARRRRKNTKCDSGERARQTLWIVNVVRAELCGHIS